MRLAAVFFLTLFSLSSNAEEENLNIYKLVMGVYRSLLGSETGDEDLKELGDLTYYYCAGRGTKEVSENITNQSDISSARIEFVFAFQDENSQEKKAGIFAVSEPSQLGTGWLVVSSKFLKDKKWNNVWDSKFTTEGFNHPLENAITGVVNDFLLRFDFKKENENLVWQDMGEGFSFADFSTEILATMNRQTNSFYWFSKDRNKGKAQGFEFVLNETIEVEGNCSMLNR